jgi:hypothetical protein
MPLNMPPQSRGYQSTGKDSQRRWTKKNPHLRGFILLRWTLLDVFGHLKTRSGGGGGNRTRGLVL